VKRVLVLNGPNLDKLGTRQPEIYGTTTLADIELTLTAQAAGLGFAVAFAQSSLVDELIAAIEKERPDGIIINPAAFTHFSHDLADALADAAVPVIEVHLSNIHAREQFRRLSVVSPVARGVVCGFGAAGYGYALDALARMLSAS
jgi:3-dehydroquinate dehydratase II